MATHTPAAPTSHTTRGQKPSANTRARERRAKTALTGLLLASAITTLALSSCGETSHTTPQTTASNSPAASTPPTTAATTTTTGAQNATSHNQTTPAASSSPSKGTTGPATHVHRAHLVLPPPGAHPEHGPTPEQTANTPVADISLSSPAITQQGHSATYTIARASTCQGQDRSPALHWSQIPSGTQELALLAISTKPVKGALYYDWAIANLKPTLTGIPTGTTPPGAILGTNSAGHATYQICPPAGKHENYLFILYALPKPLHLKPGFNPATLRQQAIHTAHHTGLLAGTND